jgi:hypothetical protein
MIVRQTSDAVSLRTNELAEIRLDRGKIEAMQPSAVSITPQGIAQIPTVITGRR